MSAAGKDALRAELLRVLRLIDVSLEAGLLTKSEALDVIDDVLDVVDKQHSRNSEQLHTHVPSITTQPDSGGDAA